uniref:C-type lectin domain-containing protein n=1 Tax=Acrobeloides nanus TaxID=290746 RepID=A0A914BUE1_9BILA
MSNDAKITAGAKSHPYHLHGRHFYVMKVVFPTGYTEDGLLNSVNTDIPCNTTTCYGLKWGNSSWLNGNVEGMSKNPTFRDTIALPIGGYVVIRFRADNPGWWFSHCHFLVHHLKGMAFAFRIGEHDQMPVPPQGFPHSCGIYKQPPLSTLRTTPPPRPGNSTSQSGGTTASCPAPAPGCPGGPYGIPPPYGCPPPCGPYTQQPSTPPPQSSTPPARPSTSTPRPSTPSPRPPTAPPSEPVCPSGWHYYQPTRKCFYMEANSYTQSAALNECTKRNGTLASISNSDENVFVANIVKQTIGGAWHVTWFGLYKSQSGGLAYYDKSPVSYFVNPLPVAPAFTPGTDMNCFVLMLNPDSSQVGWQAVNCNSTTYIDGFVCSQKSA